MVSSVTTTSPSLVRRSGGRRSSIIDAETGRRSSLLALENSALEVHEERNIRSSIVGRLGGSIRVSMENEVIDFSTFDSDDEEAGEGTRLVAKMQLGAPPPPSLLVWIFPALCCAAAYAFYNVFIKG